MRGMEDVVQSVSVSGLYSIEFEPQGKKEIPSLRYWRSGYLIKIQLIQYSWASDPDRSNQLLVIARLLSFLSTAPQIICMSGWTFDVHQRVEQFAFLKKGIEYLFRYQVSSLHKLLHKREGSIFGLIDFYTQLKYLLAYFAQSLDELWMAKAPEHTSKVYFLALGFGCVSCVYSTTLRSTPLAILTCDFVPFPTYAQKSSRTGSPFRTTPLEPHPAMR